MSEQTVTGRIAGNMAVAVKQEAKALQRIKKLHGLTLRSYNKAAGVSSVIEKKLSADPANDGLIADHEAAEKVRHGLYATLEYLRNIYKQHTGTDITAEPVKPIKKSTLRDIFQSISRRLFADVFNA